MFRQTGNRAPESAACVSRNSLTGRGFMCVCVCVCFCPVGEKTISHRSVSVGKPVRAFIVGGGALADATDQVSRAQ